MRPPLLLLCNNCHSNLPTFVDMTRSKRAGTWNFCHISKSEVLTPLDFTVQHQALHELAMRLLQQVSSVSWA